MRKITGSIISMILGFVLGGTVIGNKMNKIACEKQSEKEKFRIMYEMLEHWMRIKQRGESLEKYFKVYEYRRIAIYGMSNIGKLLLNELESKNIKVSYGIDKNKNICDRIEMFTPDDELPSVDVIVVTAIAFFDDIESILNCKVNCKIISLEDIIYEIV